MAKTPIGLGQFSGRVGGVVYAIQAGRQIVRAYQPVVTNPKSASQSIQRAKGNLVGRISKITPWQILEGLGDSKFNRRSRFLRILLQKATAGQAAGDPTTFNAKLDEFDYIFSEGSLVPMHIVPSVTADATTVSYSVATLSGAPAAEAALQGYLVVAVIKQSTGVWEQVFYRFFTPDELANGTVSASFAHVIEGAYNVTIYGAPFAAADGTKLRTRAQDLTSTASSLDAILEVGESAANVVWGASFLNRRANYTPA